MYQISVESHFDAAHFLRGYQGKCEALHGHRFRVVVSVKSSVLNDPAGSVLISKVVKPATATPKASVEELAASNSP